MHSIEQGMCALGGLSGAVNIKIDNCLNAGTGGLAEGSFNRYIRFTYFNEGFARFKVQILEVRDLSSC